MSTLRLSPELIPEARHSIQNIMHDGLQWCSQVFKVGGKGGVGTCKKARVVKIVKMHASAV